MYYSSKCKEYIRAHLSDEAWKEDAALMIRDETEQLQVFKTIIA